MAPAPHTPVYVRQPAPGGDPAQLLHTEWLLTSALGGFAMGTALGAPTRRYHALLISGPPGLPGAARRTAALSAVVERVLIPTGDGQVQAVELSTFLFKSDNPQGLLHPDGWRRLLRFEKTSGAACRWVYRLPDGAEITRTIAPQRGRREVSISYTISGAPPRCRIRLRPLLAMRDFHHLRRASQDFALDIEEIDSGVRLRRHDLDVELSVSAGAFVEDPCWWYDFFYPRELERGQDCLEDLFSPGAFTCDLDPHRELTLFASLEGGGIVPADKAATGRRERLAGLISHTLDRLDGQGIILEPDAERATAALVCAADDFVITVGDPRATPDPATASIIAGYPWFADWGRDTMIALPGLLLVAGRHDEALAALVRFARARRRGIIPNRFDDDTGEPHFNTADASLWFIHAACAYLDATADRDAFARDLMPACLDVVEHYRRGTELSIAMDPDDFLVTAGTPATQLTWMDAQRDGVTFTPRHGKPVEINALWVHALAELARAVSWPAPMTAAELRSLSEAAGRSFRAAFWLEKPGCLADVLVPEGAGWTPVRQIRPNQLFAISLSHSPLSPAQQKSVLRTVRERLVTRLGVRTLDPSDPAYRGRYEGTLFERDAAYHNGTAWPWLMGPAAEAVMRVGEFSPASRREAQALLRPLIDYLDGPTPGQLPEVFDGDDTPQNPQRPGGCPAQAWSVAEVLRVWVMTGKA